MHEISRGCIKKHTSATYFVYLLHSTITQNYEFNIKIVILHLLPYFL